MAFFGNRRQTEQPVQPVTTQHSQPVQSVQSSVAPPQPVGFETVLGANSTLEGTLRSGANVRLDGTFTGTLEISGNVLVGETAHINADINARNVSIAGAVRGNVSGKKVQLLRTGRIWGDIHATALTTEEGAFIDGKITMVSREQAAPHADDLIAEGEIIESVSGMVESEPAPTADLLSVEPDTASDAAPAEDVIDAVPVDEAPAAPDDNRTQMP